MAGLSTGARRRSAAGLSGGALLALSVGVGLAQGSSSLPADNRQHAISGLWVLDTKGAARLKAGSLPLTTEAQEKLRRDLAERAATGRLQSESHIKCLPDGMPHLMAAPFAIEYLETPGKITLLAEISNLPRTIAMDRKVHPDDLDQSWNGDAIGKWEGDVLVVDTIGFNDRPAQLFNAEVQVERTPRLHVIERIHVGADDRLIDEMTLEDPGVFTRPYTLAYTYRRLPPGSALLEYVCEVDPATLADFVAKNPAP